MTTPSRRDFLKFSAASLTAASVFPSLSAQERYTGGAPYAEKIGWRVGCQLYSFHTLTFKEAVEKTASIGLKWAEIFPTHRLAPERDVPFTAAMSADDKQFVRTVCADFGVTPHGFGVGDFDKKTFDFAKEMGFETLICEPPYEAFDTVEKLVQEYDIKIAIHNHPKPSLYWDYKNVLKACAGRDERIGACMDVNHLMRSDINPLEAIRALKGRIVSFHFGDLSQYGPTGEDVPLGTGVGKTAELLEELKAQDFKGVFAFEYEKNPGQNLDDIAQCVEFFNQTVKAFS